MTTTRFTTMFVVYAAVRLRNTIQRAFLLDGRHRGGYPLDVRRWLVRRFATLAYKPVWLLSYALIAAIDAVDVIATRFSPRD